jgi:adenylosuccinate lyase
MVGHDNYISPYSWRYGSQEMRHIWSEINKRKLWRKVWVSLAEIQAEYGLVSDEQVFDLKSNADNIDISRALEIEGQIHHDLMAELKTFAEIAPSGGEALHLGATSADIEDNADVLRTRQAFELILDKLKLLLHSLIDGVDEWAELPLMGFTHLQPAEPTTLGYRMAFYAQDLFWDWDGLRRVCRNLRGKGFKGAVGTGAAYGELIGVGKLAEFETKLAMKLKLPFFPITSQVYPRKQDYRVLSAISGLGSSLHKFAFDLRVLQSPPLGELAEPFTTKQIGSSAMPFKRNPINAEKIDSLARSLAQLPRQAWDNAALSGLERTLDDSANRRSHLPEAFLIADELIEVAQRIINGLEINEVAIGRNLSIYGPFAGIERILMALSKAGADRQAMHEHLRELSMEAWQAVELGKINPLEDLLSQDPLFQEYLGGDHLLELLDVGNYLGDAPTRARELSMEIRKSIQ